MLAFCTGNEGTVASMLDAKSNATAAELVAALRGVMGVNNLNVEMLLGRFFSREVLSEYCTGACVCVC
jgi:hypothetical protein